VIDLGKFRETAKFEQTGPLRDLSVLETRLSWFLLRLLAPTNEMAASETVFMRDHPPIKVDAMESYVRALAAAGPDQKTRLLTQAARLDEHFTAPGFQLARIAVAKKDYKAAVPWLTKVTRLDSYYMEAMFLLGLCRYNMSDFDAAAVQFRIVVADMPLSEVYNNLGAALSRKADPAALENFERALEGDQADPDYWFNVGYALWKRGKFAEAATKFRAVLDRAGNDQDATTFLGRSLQGETARFGDTRTEYRERLKTTFEDSAFRQLQAELRKK
jgi:tetratricopeptide (TPR) repeat protein